MLKPLEVACCILIAVVTAAATVMLALRLAATRPSGWLTASECVLIAIVCGFAVALASWFVAAKIHRRIGYRRQAVLTALTPLVGSIVLVAALLWPTGKSLLTAIRDDNVAKVRWVLRSGVDANTPEYWGWHHLRGSYAITLAARHGNVEVIRLLLDHGAKIDPPEDSGPLLSAATQGHLEAVELLLQAGANVNQLFGSGRMKRTAFSAAAVNGHFDVADLLVASGANPNLGDVSFAGSSSDISRLRYLAKRNVNLQECLISAARSGNVQGVKFLLGIGCDANYQTHSGETALKVVEGKLHAMETSLATANDWTPAAGWAKPEIPTEQEHKARLSSYVTIRRILLQASEAGPGSKMKQKETARAPHNHYNKLPEVEVNAE